MNRAAEVFWLPLLLLTVALLGGLRIAERVVFVRPPVSALVLAILLLGALVQSGALAPDRLVHAARSPTENASGVVVLAALFAAAVQAFNSVIPEAGVPRVVVVVFLFVLLLNTLAASADRSHALRSLAIVFGSAFVLKFIVLAALSDPATGWVKRMLQAALEGVTLGTLTQPPLAPATGYAAFFTVVCFLAGLALLPRRRLVPYIDGPAAGPARRVLTDAG